MTRACFRCLGASHQTARISTWLIMDLRASYADSSPLVRSPATSATATTRGTLPSRRLPARHRAARAPLQAVCYRPGAHFGVVHYIADEGNHRIVRVNAGTGASTGWLGHGHATWQTMATAPSGSGSADNRHFRTLRPSRVTARICMSLTALTAASSNGASMAQTVRRRPAASRTGRIGHGKVVGKTSNPPRAPTPTQASVITPQIIMQSRMVWHS